ncbi:MAG: NAD(P)/FAD-dependent oxidoreductase [Lachnospiraceae bacterium]|nr:NAD(P)/FAD-dependent oxidoreductase [Lachnospiraceae bacterium]
MKYDVVIIGAGVIGSCIARELSKYDVKALVLEKASDVCEGTSKANSGIVHAGFDAKSGTKKAFFNVEGCKKMPALSKELDFAYKNNGSLVLCFSEDDIPKLEELKKRGEENGVEKLQILSKEELLKKEPALSKDVVAALYAPTAGIVCPFNLTIAMAENAFVNGVEFKLNTEVKNVTKEGDSFKIETNNGTFETKAVVNAAGVYADTIHNFVCSDKLKITARKGEYCLYDKKVGNLVSSTIFQLPGAYGKGVLVTPTVHGNLLLGPTAEDIQDKEAVNTTKNGLDSLQKTAAKSVEAIPYKSVITSFAGLRAHADTDDFIIGESSVKGFYDCAGIESPGLTAAPAIGAWMAETLSKDLSLNRKDNFIAKREGIKSMALASTEEKEALIKKNPLYANVICRCELVTEGEIVDAIKRPLGATTLDGVKRRTRAGMGRCQAGFCSPKTLEILARELNTDMTKITKHGEGSEFLTEHKSL